MDLGELKRQVAASVHDPHMQTISEALIEQFIDESIDDLKSKGWLLPLEEDVSITLAANTYRYVVPPGFAYIRSLYMEDTDGDFSIPIPYHNWKPRYDMVTLPVFESFGFEYQNSEQALGDAAARTRVSQQFRLPFADHVKRVSLPLRKEGSPSDNLALTIQTDSSGSPSGTNVSAGAATAVDGSGLKTVLTDPDSWTNFDFETAAGAVLSADTFYHLVLARSAAVDADAYYAWGIDVDGSYIGGAMALHNGTSWQTATGSDALFRLHSPTRATAVIRFNKRFWSPMGYIGRNIKIVGQRRPPKYTKDSDTVMDGFIGYLRERSVTKALFYMATVPIDGSDPDLLNRQLAVINQRMVLANARANEAERMLASHPAEFRVKPNSRNVPGR